MNDTNALKLRASDLIITDGIDRVSNKIIYWPDDGVIHWDANECCVYDLVNLKNTQMNADSAIAKKHPEILKNCTSYDWGKDIKELPNSYERNILHTKLNTLHINIRVGIIRQLSEDLKNGPPENTNGLRELEEITLAGKVFNIKKLRIDVIEGWE